MVLLYNHKNAVFLIAYKYKLLNDCKISRTNDIHIWHYFLVDKMMLIAGNVLF